MHSLTKEKRMFGHWRSIVSAIVGLLIVGFLTAPPLGASAQAPNAVTLNCASVKIQPVPGWQESTGTLVVGPAASSVALVATNSDVVAGTALRSAGSFEHFFFEFSWGAPPAGPTTTSIHATYKVAGVEHSSNSCDFTGLIGMPWVSPSFVSGADRYLTAVAVAQHAYPTTAPVVFIASGENYPDALSAAPAAAQLGGPLLLVPSGNLPGQVANEISSLAPQIIYVVGGAGAVSPNVFRQLKTLAPQITRLSGSDRYATSRAVAQGIFSGATTVFITTGTTFPDAVSAVSAASVNHAPIVLVNGQVPSLDPETLAVLKGLRAQNIAIVGGTGAVSAGIETKLHSQFPSTIRLGGSDRYATSNVVNTHYFTQDQARVLLTVGNDFPDALSGSTLAAVNHAPLMITDPHCVSDSELTSIAVWQAHAVTIIGGTSTNRPELAYLRSCLEVQFFNP